VGGCNLDVGGCHYSADGCNLGVGGCNLDVGEGNVDVGECNFDSGGFNPDFGEDNLDMGGDKLADVACGMADRMFGAQGEGLYLLFRDSEGSGALGGGSVSRRLHNRLLQDVAYLQGEMDAMIGVVQEAAREQRAPLREKPSRVQSQGTPVALASPARSLS